MTWPIDDLVTTSLDQDTDSPLNARPEILALAQKVSAILATITAGATPWHSGNDGAGSGLDADTVDGIQGAAIALLAGATFTGRVDVTAGAINLTDIRNPSGASLSVRRYDTTTNHFQTYNGSVSQAEGDLHTLFAMAAGISNSYAPKIYFTTQVTAPNAANCSMMLPKAVSTNRSLNAAGTVNVSGADYAEYETKRDDCGDIAKGDIVGFDADGLLTDKFDLAVTFGVKSTDPSFVGGDTWHSVEVPHLELESAPPPPALPHQRVLRKLDETTRNQLVQAHEAYTAAYHESQARDADARVRHAAAMEAHRAEHEAARARVDRVAYAGKVPVNVTGAQSGDWIVPARRPDGGIAPQVVSDKDMTFEQYRLAVGRVRNGGPDGRAVVAVKSA